MSPGPGIRSFEPVHRKDARVLILGSMPGAASLAAAQYYAHPRNAFWPIMGALFAAGPDLPYPERLSRLLEARIALWDVIGRCQRAGSLDSAIATDSIEANDLPGLFAACPELTHIFFNGSAAEAAFRKHIGPVHGGQDLTLARLPSTSPAHAALGLADKLAAWQAVRTALPYLPEFSCPSSPPYPSQCCRTG